MVRSVFMLLIAVLVFCSGFGSIHSEMEFIDGGGTEESSGHCGKILTTIQISQNKLDTLDNTVQNITSELKDCIELGFFNFFEKTEDFIDEKFDELDKKIDSKIHDFKTIMESKLTVIEDRISEITSHVDSKINSLESTITHALNVSDTLKDNNACYQESLETAAFIKNTRTIDDMNIRTLNITVKLQEMNKAIQKLTDIFVLNTDKKLAHNISDIITTTEASKPAPTKCDRSQQEECCTAAVVGASWYTDYTDMFAGRHTVVNMTSAGLQEYTMYFAVRGEKVDLSLSSTSPRRYDLYYEIGFYDLYGGDIFMNERLPTTTLRTVRSDERIDVINREHYTYYYLTISGDTLAVGRRGKPPLLTYTSTELKTLKYFSFKRWWGADAGEALYDCTAE